MCNGRSNPYSDNAGTVAKFPLSTYELLFVKVKGKNADSTSHLARAAIAYDAWLSSDNRTVCRSLHLEACTCTTTAVRAWMLSS